MLKTWKRIVCTCGAPGAFRAACLGDGISSAGGRHGRLLRFRGRVATGFALGCCCWVFHHARIVRDNALAAGDTRYANRELAKTSLTPGKGARTSRGVGWRTWSKTRARDRPADATPNYAVPAANDRRAIYETTGREPSMCATDYRPATTAACTALGSCAAAAAATALPATPQPAENTPLSPPRRPRCHGNCVVASVRTFFPFFFFFRARTTPLRAHHRRRFLLGRRPRYVMHGRKPPPENV